MHIQGEGVSYLAGGGGLTQPSTQNLKALAESEEKAMEGMALQMQVTEGGRRRAGRSLSVWACEFSRTRQPPSE